MAFVSSCHDWTSSLIYCVRPHGQPWRPRRQTAAVMASASAGGLALEGDVVAVEALLAEQGDGVVNVADEDGRTMLHWAASGGHPALVACLLQHGALPNVTTQAIGP